MLIGNSRAFSEAVRLLTRFAACDAHVLIEGETGTGKELAARKIHYSSRRSAGPFVPVNCGAIPDTLLENELFGHSKGAFTDAQSNSAGLVGLAQGGTVFLDEVDSLSCKGQVALLRFLQDGSYRPIGGREECRGDVRVIAAANVDLESLCRRGAFRRDLLFRIKLLFIEMPPLRCRHGDIGLLVECFLADCSRRYGISAKRLAPAAAQCLEAYSWPGNVRELENVVHRAFLLSEGEEIGLVDVFGILSLAEEAGRAPGNAGNRGQYRAAKARAIDDFHRRYLSILLRSSRGNISSAARDCGTDRRVLGRLIKRYQIDIAQYRLP